MQNYHLFQAKLGVRLGYLLDLPNQPAHDHGQEQVRVRGAEDGKKER